MTPLRRGERANANKFWLRLCRDMGFSIVSTLQDAY
jgi:hypothetical protein